MSSLNKVMLIGNVGKDPDIKSFQNGGKVANFSIATAETWKDKNTGEKKERTEWHNIAVFNEGLVGVIERYVKKGSKVYVEGQLQTRKWQDQSGADRWSTEVVLKPFNGTLVLLGDPKAQGGGSNGAGNGGYSSQANENNADQGGANNGGYDDLDDDIPF